MAIRTHVSEVSRNRSNEVPRLTRNPQVRRNAESINGMATFHTAAQNCSADSARMLEPPLRTILSKASAWGMICSAAKRAV